jgi:hypothetical protein
MRISMPNAIVPFKPEAKMATRVLTFKLEKLTKNTCKFAEVEVPGQPPAIGSLYVQKWVAGQAQEIKVTIEIPD